MFSYSNSPLSNPFIVGNILERTWNIYYGLRKFLFYIIKYTCITKHTAVLVYYIMRKRLMLKEIISLVKLSLLPVWCWPQPQNATKFKMLCVKLYHCLSIILEIALGLPLIYGVKNHLDNPVLFVNQILLVNGTIHTTYNFIFHRVNYRHIQVININIITLKIIFIYNIEKIRKLQINQDSRCASIYLYINNYFK